MAPPFAGIDMRSIFTQTPPRFGGGSRPQPTPRRLSPYEVPIPSSPDKEVASRVLDALDSHIEMWDTEVQALRAERSNIETVLVSPCTNVQGTRFDL